MNILILLALLIYTGLCFLYGIKWAQREEHMPTVYTIRRQLGHDYANELGEYHIPDCIHRLVMRYVNRHGEFFRGYNEQLNEWSFGGGNERTVED